MMDEFYSVFVRPATLHDLESLADGNGALAWETEHRRLDHSRLRAGVLALLQDSHKGQYFVAEITPPSGPSVIVGQLLVTFEWSDWRNGNFWWLQSVYVHPDHRRKGVFRRLYGYVRKEAESRQEAVCGFRLYVEQDNTVAHQSYDRLGFQKSPYRMYECELPVRIVHSSLPNGLTGRPDSGD